MRGQVFATFFLFLGLIVRLQAASETTPQEIAAAVLPLPEQLRSGAAVVRLSPTGVPELIRSGTNNMVCIAGRPGDDTFDIRCYHQDFIEVVYRGFQLRAQGVAGTEVADRIEAEIKTGKIHLPEQPTAGYRCLGPASGYNASSNALSGEIRCWQSIHFPFRTAHEMGLMDESEIPAALRASMPYVMSSGRYWAHVMIEHPSSGANSEHRH